MLLRSEALGSVCRILDTNPAFGRSGNAHGRLLRGEPVVHIADVMEDEAYRSGHPIRRTLVELGGGRTLLAVPLRKDEVFLGDFVIYRQEVARSPRSRSPSWRTSPPRR